MATPFPSDDWAKELMTIVNDSPAYKSAAKKWEGDLTFVIQAGTGQTEDKYIYLDLNHGVCHSAQTLGSLNEKNSAFKITAPIDTWKEVLQGRLDPIRGITSRKLKLEGNLMKVLKAPKAAIELVNCAREIDTAWPG